jgi:hypothetical protein
MKWRRSVDEFLAQCLAVAKHTMALNNLPSASASLLTSLQNVVDSQNVDCHGNFTSGGVLRNALAPPQKKKRGLENYFSFAPAK